jgi:allantoinase
VHVVHLSSSDALSTLEAARARGVPITAETCPHYLTFASEDIPDGETQYKCCPPIRERENREKLWDGLARGVLDVVVSDHSPCTPALKRLDEGDFMAAWGGISSLQLGLSTIWTEARRRGHDLRDLARWMSEGPAALAGLADRKGAIAVGCDADLVAFAPDAPLAVSPSMIRHRHALTPYAGRALSGVVTRTFLRGAPIYTRGDDRAATETGKFLAPVRTGRP